jgi:hypothetical protein
MSTEADAAFARLQKLGIGSYDPHVRSVDETYIVLYDIDGKTVFPVNLNRIEELIAALKEHIYLSRGHRVRNIIFTDRPFSEMSEGAHFQSSTGQIEFRPPVGFDRIKELHTYFEEQTGCTVLHEWKSDFQSYRFYFQDKIAKDWQYVLDVHQDDVNENTTGEIIQQLS